MDIPEEGILEVDNPEVDSLVEEGGIPVAH